MRRPKLRLRSGGWSSRIDVVGICAIEYQRHTSMTVLQWISYRESIEIIEDLAAASIYGTPVQLWLERPCIVVTWNITSTAGILVLPVSSSANASEHNIPAILATRCQTLQSSSRRL